MYAFCLSNLSAQVACELGNLWRTTGELRANLQRTQRLPIVLCITTSGFSDSIIVPFSACLFPDLPCINAGRLRSQQIWQRGSSQTTPITVPAFSSPSNVVKSFFIYSYKISSIPSVSSAQPCRPPKTCISILNIQHINIPRPPVILHTPALQILPARIIFLLMTMKPQFPNKIAPHLHRIFLLTISSRRSTKSAIMERPQPESRSPIHTPAFSPRRERSNGERFGITRLKNLYLVLMSCMSAFSVQLLFTYLTVNRSALGAPHRRTIYMSSLEAHIDRLHTQLLTYVIHYSVLRPTTLTLA